jgi:lipid-binding SYLF domain-containing protein
MSDPAPAIAPETLEFERLLADLSAGFVNLSADRVDGAITDALSFLIGGAGGKGLVRDVKTKKTTYMDMAQASAGLQAGIAQNETLIIFKSEKAMNEFVNKGWEFGGGGSAQAGVAGSQVGAGGGENVIADATYYTLTKNGLQAGGALAGTKFWKDKELN